MVWHTVQIIVSVLLAIQSWYCEGSTSLFYGAEKGPNLNEYMCSVCVQVFSAAITAAADTADSSTTDAAAVSANKATTLDSNFLIAFDNRCSFFNACDRLKKVRSVDVVKNDARETCQSAGFCPINERWQEEGPAKLQQRIKEEGAAAASLDVRIAKAYGARGYDKIRLSIISNTSLADSKFTYQEQFKYRWTDQYLNTAVVDVIPGQKNDISINISSGSGKDDEEAVVVTLSVYVPAAEEGVRGVIIADPCFQSQWIICLHKDEFDTFNRMTSLLNAINAHADVHYWMILGDNFYDQEGEATKMWFDALTLQTKSKIMASVPGNHDYWVHGSPKLAVPEDQMGNGFMQFYGQDVAASFRADQDTTTTAPYDFTVNPDDNSNGEFPLPPLDNYFFYHSIGNTAFIGYSGAYSFEESLPYFEEACAWADSVDPAVVLLMGHWNGDGDGCQEEMTVPAAYSELLSVPMCAKIASRMRYVEGHTHCNRVMEENVGFMVAGQGMSGCGDFGFPVFDTTAGEFAVYYFPVQQGGLFEKFDNYDKILSCIKEKGVSGCYDLATKWATAPLL